MPSLIYSPGIRVYIDTEEHGILDVSQDLIEGSMIRRTDGVSTFDFQMNNARRKYDGVFKPNDRIVVLMKRLTWLRVFTGYLNSVPLKTAWPQPVQLSASDSLKRLQYWFWDPYNQQTQDLIMHAISQLGGTKNADTGVINAVLTILRDVVGWDESKVHIGLIPEDWFKFALEIAKRLEPWAAESDTELAKFIATLSPGGVISGQPLSASVSGVLQPGKYGGVSWDNNRDELRNAEIIFSVGAQMNMSSRDIQIALMTAMQESTLYNNPGGDRDSVGLFQQRPSQGWGTVKQIMDPEYAATKFYKALKALKNRNNMPLWEAAAEVQKPAEEYRRKYDDWKESAAAIVRALNTAPTTGGTTGTVGVATNEAFLATALDLVERYPNIRYTQEYGGDRPDILKRKPPPGLDCSSFVQWVYLNAVGDFRNVPRVSAGQAAWCERIDVRKALDTQGALLFVSNNGKPSGVHHVEVSLGNGRSTVGAHKPGTPAGVTNNDPSYWSFGGLMPKLSYLSVGKGGGPRSAAGAAAGTLVGGSKIWPVGKDITQGFKNPNTRYAAGYHTGVDFDAILNDPVKSASDGKVVHAGTDPESAYGITVRIKSGDVLIMYCHLEATEVSQGATVKAGDTIGRAGSTGESTGVHLHMECRTSPFKYDNKIIDPVKFITDGIVSGVPVAGGAGGGGGGQLGEFWQTPPEWQTQEGYNPDDPIDKLFGATPWVPIGVAEGEASLEANALTGVRALLNDQALLPYLKNLFASTMRSFCSAPNGDLMAWFPDYYGLWGTAAKLRLEPIEIQDFNVIWSDDFFVTHQFVVSGESGTGALDIPSGAVQSAMRPKFYTYGIANIDMPEMLEALFGIQPESAEKFARWVYNRFGVRPDYQEVPGLIGPRAEFFAALYLFMRQWAYQYNADVPVTFMPEAWPGMLIQVPRFDFQAYITTVTHTFRFGEGGGFNTTINIAAPAYMPRKGKASRDHALFGLPVAGQYAPGRGIGNAPQVQRVGRPTEVPRTDVTSPGVQS